MDINEIEKKINEEYQPYIEKIFIATKNPEAQAEVLGILKQYEEDLRKKFYWSACSGCSDGHPSYWKTVVESPQWKAWEKEVHKRVHDQLGKDRMEGVYDIDECRECGFISAGHFQDFLKFIELEKNTNLRTAFNLYIAKVAEQLGHYFSGSPISHEVMDEAYKTANKALDENA